MEPRAAIGEFDRATGDYTLWTTSQNPHVIRLLMGAFVLGIPSTSCASSRRMSAAVSAQDLPLRRRSHRHLGVEEDRPAGQVGGRAFRELRVRRPWPRPRHPRRTGAGCGRQVPWAAGCRRWPTWARIFRHSRRRSRHTFTPPCWPGSTRHRRSMPRSRPSSPTPFPWTPTGVPGGRKPAT